MKIRITATIIKEYEPNPEYYGDTSPEGMLKIDLSGATDDPELFFDSCNWDIRGEIVAGDEK